MHNYNKEANMALQKLRRLSNKQIKEDHEALVGLQSIPNYAPPDPNYSTERLLMLENNAEVLRDRVVQTRKLLNNLLDDLAFADNESHTAVQRMKLHVLSQFGPDSSEVQLIGLTRKSEYRRGVRRVAPPSSNPHG
jgi:hypothetical protein